MNTRISLSLLFSGMALLTLGGLFKLLHWPSANIQLMVGALAQTIALVALAGNVLRRRTWKRLVDAA